jgi:hypothetical protein
MRDGASWSAIRGEAPSRLNACWAAYADKNCPTCATDFADFKEIRLPYHSNPSTIKRLDVGKNRHFHAKKRLTLLSQQHYM